MVKNTIFHRILLSDVSVDPMVAEYRWAPFLVSVFILAFALWKLGVYMRESLRVWLYPAEETVPVGEFGLEPLANYINRMAMASLVPYSERQFYASFSGETLTVRSYGIAQEAVHRFLEKIFHVLNMEVIVQNLRMGGNLSNVYVGQLIVARWPQFGIPIERPEVINRRFSLMEDYSRLLAKELVRVYPLNSARVDYLINPQTGLIKIFFKPVAGASIYFGASDLTKSVIKDIKGVMNQLAVDGKWKNFRYVNYGKDKKTKISTLTVRLHILEDELWKAN